MKNVCSVLCYWYCFSIIQHHPFKYLLRSVLVIQMSSDNSITCALDLLQILNWFHSGLAHLQGQLRQRGSRLAEAYFPKLLFLLLVPGLEFFYPSQGQEGISLGNKKLHVL